MKKSLLFFTLLAGIAVMTGCKKDQDVVTLKAVVERDTKAYFGSDTYTPYWEDGDKVIINNIRDTYDLTLPSTPTTYATVRDVTASDNYCAIYPANIVERMGTPTASGTKATIYFDPHQMYIEKDGHQCVNMPMGAVTNNTDKTFYFKNLCSILRLQVKNTLQTTIKVKRITIYAYGAYLAGSADVTLAPGKNGETVITEITTDGPAGDDVENVLSVYREDGKYMKSIASTTTESFDIVVPPFDANKLNIELEIYDDGDDSEDDNDDTFLGNTDGDIANPPAVGYNKIINITYQNYTVEKPDYAYLMSGPDFNDVISGIANGATGIIFNPSWNGTFPLESYDQNYLNNLPATSPWHGWVIVSSDDSPLRIWAFRNGTTIQVVSSGYYYYADENSRGMFQNLSSVESIEWAVSNTSEYGFITEDVTDMSYMFAGCTSLREVDGLQHSNFSNVTNMSHMFEDCTTISNNIVFNPLNTHNLRDTGMVAMFKGCINLTTLNLSTFTTHRVTSMRDMFNGCVLLGTLHLDNFDMTNVTNYENMCKNMCDRKNGNNPCTVYCPLSVEIAITTKDGNGNYYSGLDETANGNYADYIIWPDQYTQLKVKKILFSRP